MAIADKSKRDLIGKGFFEVFPENPYEENFDWQNPFLTALQNKTPSKTPTKKYLRPIPGSDEFEVKYYEAVNTPYLDENGEVQFIIRSITDLTEIINIQNNEQATIKSLVKNEKFLRETQKITNVGSWELDLIQKKVFWSEVVKEIHEVENDYQPTLEAGLNFYVAGENRKLLIEAIDAALEHGHEYDLELQMITAKGKTRWVRTTGRPERINGQCTRLYGALQDITDGKVTEQDLLASRNQFQSLIQTVEGIVWEADAITYKSTFISDKVKCILGYTPQEWLSEPDFWQNHIYPGDRKEAMEFYHSRLNNTKNHTLDYRMIKSDGSIVWIRDMVTSIKENGKPKWLRGLMVDITVSKRFSDRDHLEKAVLKINSQKGRTVQQVLSVYLQGIEVIFPQLRCSLFQVNEGRLIHWASPSLPKRMVEAIEKAALNEQTFSCAAAAFLKKEVVVEDISKELGWADLSTLALANKLSSCWSYPVFNTEGKVLAIFTLYCSETRKPGEEETRVIERSVALLKVIIENRQYIKIIQDTSLLMKQGQEMAHLGHWKWDISKGVVKWSDSLYDIYGLSKSSYFPTFEKYLELVHPEEREGVYNQILDVLNTHEDKEFEERIVRPDGEVRWLKSWCRLIPDEDGQPLEMVGACLDITSSKKVQEELSANELRLKKLVALLKESNERFEYVNKATNDAIYDWDIANDRIQWGDGFYKLFGFQGSLNKTHLKRWNSNIHSTDIVLVEQILDEVQKDPNRHKLNIEYKFKRADDSYAFVEENGYVIRDMEGKAVRMIGVLRDISERKLAETKLKELHQELERNLKILSISNAELERFAHVVSHDLQEPLRMITSFLSQLEKKYGEVLDDKAKQYIFFAVDGAKRMRQIILNLLEFSRVGIIEDKISDVDLNKLLHEILAVNRRKIKQKQARIEFSQLPVLYTYKTLIRQIFQNLISNGLIYQHDENIPHISISSEETEGHWLFMVSDNGIGIDSVFYDKIFLIFQRLHHGEDHPGTGMGLAVTKKIVESLGGKIWLESTQGVGSNFYFTLPKRSMT